MELRAVRKAPQNRNCNHKAGDARTRSGSHIIEFHRAPTDSSLLKGVVPLIPNPRRLHLLYTPFTVVHWEQNLNLQ